MTERPRRLRWDPVIRDLTRETRLSRKALIWPLFIKEGSNSRDEISSLPNQFQCSPDRIGEEIERGLRSGVNKFLLFGLPRKRIAAGARPMRKTALCSRESAPSGNNMAKKFIWLPTCACASIPPTATAVF